MGRIFIDRLRCFGSAAMLGLVGLVSGALGQPVGTDFNADGSSDYPVSIISYDDTNPDVGAARIWSGASKTIIHTIVGTDTNTLFGWSTGSAGDLDGDGKDDLIVGEPLWSAASNHEGRIQVFSGDDASVLLTITGPYVDTGLGRYVTGIGDWDGDGVPDIAASGWDIADTDGDGIGDDPIGMVYIFSGANGALLTEITDPTATRSFGYSIFGLGDITGDGKADIAITDPYAEQVPGAGMPGQLYIFEGSATAAAYDLTDAHRTISNTDPATRVFAAQVDVMHPDLWLDEPTLQVISLTEPGTGGVNEAPIAIDIRKADGTLSGTKGTRLSLQLAGDINLDGVVDAADLQDSISQLGTDPQAIGVMPIADSNGDGIIDLLDVQVVVDGYGQSTDIYEGLWDGSRLLSVAARAAGFGSTANISGNPFGGTQFGGGRRPIDDCNRSTTPPDTPGTLVPSLLREDAERSCSACPEYDDNPSCYECETDKSVSGGSVDAIPEQPTTAGFIFFSVEGVSEIPGLLKCIESCGDDGKTAPTPLGEPLYVWEVLTKGPDGWPEEHDPNIDSHSGWPGGEEIAVFAGACDEIRAICWAKPSGPCVPDPAWTRIGEKSVQVADFTLDYWCTAATPTNTKRTTIGIREEVTVVVDPLSSAITWKIDDGATTQTINGGNFITFTAPNQAGTVEITATSSANCSRSLIFDVIEPEGVELIIIQYQHKFGWASSGFCAEVYILPTSVSFTGLQIREGTADAVATGSFWCLNDLEHQVTSPAPAVGENNLLSAIDDVNSNVCHDGPSQLVPGTFTWPIPWEYSYGGPWVEFAVVPVHSSVDEEGTVTTERAGASSTHEINEPTRECP